VTIANEADQVLIVDEATVDGRGVWSLLDSEPGIEIEALAKTAQEAIGLAVEPRVILLGLVSCDAPDFECIMKLKARFPDARILVLAHTVDVAAVSTVIAAGGDGYISKSASASEVVQAVRAVARGDQYLDSAIGITLATDRHPACTDDTLGDLTPKETEVLRDIALGYTNVEIGRRLAYGVRTIEKHRAHNPTQAPRSHPGRARTSCPRRRAHRVNEQDPTTPGRDLTIEHMNVAQTPSPAPRRNGWSRSSCSRSVDRSRCRGLMKRGIRSP